MFEDVLEEGHVYLAGKFKPQTLTLCCRKAEELKNLREIIIIKTKLKF